MHEADEEAAAVRTVFMMTLMTLNSPEGDSIADRADAVTSGELERGTT